ncbi:MAG: SDR family oxidoreductase [Xanthomonadales bacterium]|nr:SDR family oxidoreductase [Xanthomonadales bacterium]
MTAERNRRTALITGASSGIGLALAREYAYWGCNLVLVARRRERLEQLAAELKQEHGCECIVAPADLADPASSEAIVAALEARGKAIDVLVNNAGYGVPGKYLRQPWTVHQDFLQVMVTTVAELTHRLLGPMVERGHGRIVNIASVAGHLPGSPGHTLYNASKSWMIRFTESLAFELQGTGVTATAVCPGFTYSEFHDVTGTRHLADRLPKYMWMDADTVARQAYQAAELGEIVYVNGRWNRFLVWFERHLPRRVSYALVRRRSKRFRDQSQQQKKDRP